MNVKQALKYADNIKARPEDVQGYVYTTEEIALRTLAKAYQQVLQGPNAGNPVSTIGWAQMLRESHVTCPNCETESEEREWGEENEYMTAPCCDVRVKNDVLQG